jgi:NADH:ubiquinone oxidoreductase subunit 5 (subunit L)/multisubunit Na+/H+ antiporter MnhA subunit
VNHATGTFDMRLMGGLRRAMPVTYATFMVASLSLAGVFPLAGFWSKDEILGSAWDDDRLLFFVAMAVVFMTAFYSFRAVFLTFHGDYRGGAVSEHGEAGGEARPASDVPAEDAHPGTPHESPPVMALPLLLLAVPAVLAGMVNLPLDGADRLANLLEGALPDASEELLHHAEFSWPIAIASSVLALSGIALALAIYEAKVISAQSLRQAFGPLHTLLSRKYYLDELYEGVVVREGLYRRVTRAAQWVDTNIIDGAVNGAASLTRRASDTLRWVQSGSVQAYGTVGFGGLVLASALMLLLVER